MGEPSPFGREQIRDVAAKRRRRRPLPAALLALLALPLLVTLLSGCGGGSSSGATTAGTPRPSGTTSATGTTATVRAGSVRVRVTEVARNLDTVWALAWDAQGRLWYTQRGGTLTRLGETPRKIAGVVENGEGGLMGLELDRQDRVYLMYTAANENRIVRLNGDGTQTVLVRGIRAASIHDGGRLRFGPDGMLYAGTGDAGDGDLARPNAGALNGRILRKDPASGKVTVVSTGHRNPQGLCFAPDGRLFSTEHGPDHGDEINIITPGSDGGWPDVSGNGIHNYTPTIAPAGCTFYTSNRIPQWNGSLFFVTLKDQSLHRLTFTADGSVSGDEVLFKNQYGRLRAVRVGPDGDLYIATSSRDGRGSPGPSDDRILRVSPAG